MTDEKDTKPKAKDAKEGNVTLSAADLVALVNTVVEKSSERNEQTTKALVEALLESRKPYISPAQEQNEKTLRESFKQLEQRKKLSLEQEQQVCPHYQGSNALSEETGDRAAIVWHHLDTGTWFGICTNCQRQFWPEDADYREQWNRKSGNKRSSAGQRQFLDPAAVRKAGR